jgi:hypothetical protein
MYRRNRRNLRDRSSLPVRETMERPRGAALLKPARLKMTIR